LIYIIYCIDLHIIWLLPLLFSLQYLSESCFGNDNKSLSPNPWIVLFFHFPILTQNFEFIPNPFLFGATPVSNLRRIIAVQVRNLKTLFTMYWKFKIRLQTNRDTVSRRQEATWNKSNIQGRRYRGGEGVETPPPPHTHTHCHEQFVKLLHSFGKNWAVWIWTELSNWIIWIKTKPEFKTIPNSPTPPIDILYKLDSASLLVKLKPRIFQR
jgi:hypothetical protein